MEHPLCFEPCNWHWHQRYSVKHTCTQKTKHKNRELSLQMLTVSQEGQVGSPSFRIYSVKLLYSGGEVMFYFFPETWCLNIQKSLSLLVDNIFQLFNPHPYWLSQKVHQGEIRINIVKRSLFSPSITSAEDHIFFSFKPKHISG